jgi:C4-dicarboxylate-specific signal transduction histidine kinase
VETDLASSLPTGNSLQLREALFNLDMNAMDAMASTPDALRSLRICTRATSTGIVEVYLKDHGRQQLFVPFYTTKDHGLGLAVSMELRPGNDSAEVAYRPPRREHSLAELAVFMAAISVQLVRQ